MTFEFFFIEYLWPVHFSRRLLFKLVFQFFFRRQYVDSQPSLVSETFLGWHFFDNFIRLLATTLAFKWICFPTVRHLLLSEGKKRQKTNGRQNARGYGHA